MVSKPMQSKYGHRKMLTANNPEGRPNPWLSNMTAKIAAVPMIATALVVFVGCSMWSVVYSFTGSRSLPKENFVGLKQYDRLFSSNRWIESIENIAIFGVCTLVFSLSIGFLLAVFMDQKIRFENTFRTIFLYPFALSFIAVSYTHLTLPTILRV